MPARSRFRLRRANRLVVFDRSSGLEIGDLRLCHVRPEGPPTRPAGPPFNSHDRKVVGRPEGRGTQRTKEFVRPEGPTVNQCRHEKPLANIVIASLPRLARFSSLTRLPCRACLENTSAYWSTLRGAPRIVNRGLNRTCAKIFTRSLVALPVNGKQSYWPLEPSTITFISTLHYLPQSASLTSSMRLKRTHRSGFTNHLRGCEVSPGRKVMALSV